MDGWSGIIVAYQIHQYELYDDQYYHPHREHHHEEEPNNDPRDRVNEALC